MEYHGEVYNDGDPFVTVEGERGYATIVTIKVELMGGGFEFYLCADQARELARHLTEAAAALAARRENEQV